MIVPICIFLAGAILTFVSRRNLQLGWASRDWPHSTGKVVGQQVHEGVVRRISTDGTYAPKDVPFRDVDWIIEYSVGGSSYTTSRFSFWSTGWNANTGYLDEGDEIEVYYSPDDPSVAVVRPGLSPNLILGPLLLAIGIGWILYMSST